MSDNFFAFINFQNKQMEKNIVTLKLIGNVIDLTFI